jgi:peptidyl-prolyl cis-trans isomerase A (cyclophilin A)
MRARHLPPAILAALTVLACGGDTDEERSAEALSPIFFPKRLTATAPEAFRASFETTEGTFVVEVRRSWAPLGADRFYNLVTNGFYDDVRVYRVIEGFMAQFGLNGDPRVNYQWRNAVLVDDPVTHTNARGSVSFAKGGPNSRTTEVFVSYRDNAPLDERGFAPIGTVVEGMDVVDRFNAGYGDGPPRGTGPYQAQAQLQGNAYLDTEFPELTRIVRAWVQGSDPDP